MIHFKNANFYALHIFLNQPLKRNIFGQIVKIIHLIIIHSEINCKYTCSMDISGA